METQRMKRTQLAGAAIALALIAPDAARAQIPVTDALANAQAQITNSQLYQQVAQAVTTVRQLEQQYQQLQATYNVLAHTTNVSTYANRLGSVANGFGANQIGGAMTGLGSLAGAAEQVANLRFFSSSGTDFSATELTRRAQRLGNIQAAAVQGMQQSEQRITGLRELMGEIDGQPDVQASAALNNRIQAEHALLSAQQQQLAQLQMMAAVQQQGDVLRAEEAQRQSAEQWRDSLPPLGND
ncbi:type IV secretion system protein [Paeniroseomonas aquatica]